jgi:uncharacterized protein
MSASLVAAVAVMAASQLGKAVVASIRDGRLRLDPLVSTGGMPSAHSAFVTALAVSVALWRGIGSDAFAVCAVFASIIVYDSVRLRGMVDIHTRIIRDLQARVPGSSGTSIPRWVGHSAAETLVGIAVGGAGALGCYLVLRGISPGGTLGIL